MAWKRCAILIQMVLGLLDQFRPTLFTKKKKKKDECRMKTISYSFPVETHAFQPSGAIIPSNTDL